MSRRRPAAPTDSANLPLTDRMPKNASTTTILLADDHPLARVGIRMLLTRVHPKIRVIEARDYPEALRLGAENPHIDLILLDLMMPGMSGTEGLRRLRTQCPNTPIVIMSAVEEAEQVWQCLDHGARGYILKTSSEEVIRSALQLVMSGGLYLPPSLLSQYRIRTNGAAHRDAEATADPALAPMTRRQLDVLQLLALGRSNKSIANELNISKATVCTHINAIYRILNVRNRTEATHAAIARGLVG